MRLTPTNADDGNDADLPVDRALTQSICPNRRGRRFSGARLCEPHHVDCLVLINLPHASCLAKLLRVTDSRSGARLCEPQHVESDRRAGFVTTLAGGQSPCGSQTRAPLVAAPPRYAVSQSCTMPTVGERQRVGPIPHSADCKSAIRHSLKISCVRQKICFERVTAFSLPPLLKKEERAGERRDFLSISPLSDSLPARSSRGERGKTPQAFCVPNTTD